METTAKVRSEFREYAERTGDEEMQALVRDADRLAVLEREHEQLRDGIRALADAKEERAQQEYDDGCNLAACDYQDDADALRALLADND